jgi:hypothetical protein
MNNSDEITSLLREGIAASNRTTRAVRAFVRFLFIQLSASTLAAILIYFGSVNATVGLIVIGVIVWLVGVLWSSTAGWQELEKSDPDRFENRALTESQIEELRIQEKQRLEAFDKAETARMATEEKQRVEAAEESAKRQEEIRTRRRVFFLKWRYKILVIFGAVVVLIVALGMFVRASPSVAAQVCAQINGQVLPPPSGSTVVIDDSDGTFECTVFVLSGYVGVEHWSYAGRIPNFPYLVEGNNGNIEISPR